MDISWHIPCYKCTHQGFSSPRQFTIPSQSTEVLLPTIFDPSELRSDFNGKVIRAPAALASRDAAVLQRCSFGRRMEKDGEWWYYELGVGIRTTWNWVCDHTLKNLEVDIGRRYSRKAVSISQCLCCLPVLDPVGRSVSGFLGSIVGYSGIHQSKTSGLLVMIMEPLTGFTDVYSIIRTTMVHPMIPII